MTAAALKAAVSPSTAGTAVAKAGPPKDFPAMLEQWKPEIARALPRHLNADRMARIALTCFRNVPKLGDCDPKSVFAAVIQAAQLGIEPGLLGEAHLIPYKDKCQLIPGYQGLIKLAKQTGQVVDIYAMAVREKDKFSCAFGLQRTLEHVPLTAKGGFPASIKERGEIIGVYAVAVFKDGARTFVVMGDDEVKRIRDGSSGYQMAVKYKKDSPWTTHYEEMALKTAIRRLCKTLPKSPELAQALALEETHNRGKAQNIDLRDAVDGTYQAPGTDEVVDVDPMTGEVIEGQPADAPAVNATDAVPPAPAAVAEPEPTAKRGPTIHDALALVRAGQYDDALAFVAGKRWEDGDRAEIKAAIEKHKAGEAV